MKAEVPFICPICQKALHNEGKSLACEAKHRFDLARQGYVNLLLKKPVDFYENKELFLARRAVYQAGFFDEIIRSFVEEVPGGPVLDAGCGEGSLLSAVAEGKRAEGIGLDISKCAVSMAAGAYKQMRWCVGDLCKLPLSDGSMGCIINMLSPANYGEFIHALRPGGVLIKLIPNPDHLREIRAISHNEKPDWKGEEATLVFSQHLAVKEKKRIRYTIDCSVALAEQVYRMTPMTANKPLPDMRNCTITVDTTMLIGWKKDAYTR